MVIINEICQMSITSPPGRRLRDSPPDELREKDTPAIIVCEKFPERFELLKDCEKKLKGKPFLIFRGDERLSFTNGVL
jgi:hypothetical protein